MFREIEAGSPPSSSSLRIYAEGREETEPCQASTPGCSIDHTAEAAAGLPEAGCESW